MAEDRGVRIPMSTGGLISYYDEYKSRLKIKPAYVILLIIASILFEIALRVFVPT
jgi:preprotein translocase subunit Sec61beta